MIFARQILGLAQQRRAKALAARFSRDEKLRDIEPTPMDDAAHPAQPKPGRVAGLQAKGFFVARAKIFGDFRAKRVSHPRHGGGAVLAKNFYGLRRVLHGAAISAFLAAPASANPQSAQLASGADSHCDLPAEISAPREGPLAPASRITQLHPLLLACARDKADGQAEKALAIREFQEKDEKFYLLADPEKLTTRIARAACFTCAETTDEAQAQTRLFRALDTTSQQKGKTLPAGADWLDNAGLTRGQKAEGAFLTGDLCPSHKPLDRGFLASLEQKGAATPIALSVSGLWMLRHAEDFQWLRREKAEGRLDVTFVNHSFRHPYRPGLADGKNFLLMPGVDFTAEVLELERLLLANGETPSLFFRFPGLISNRAQMDALRALHLIPLGAQAWLALSGAAAPGAIVLVHPNGNEPFGLSAFNRLRAENQLPRPWRPLSEAP